MSDWQPIETAPSDGTPVLMFFPMGADDGNDGHMPCMAVMKYVFEVRGSAIWQGYYSGIGPHGEPTHWMPLPKPPEAA